MNKEILKELAQMQKRLREIFAAGKTGESIPVSVDYGSFAIYPQKEDAAEVVKLCNLKGEKAETYDGTFYEGEFEGARVAFYISELEIVNALNKAIKENENEAV